MASGYPVHKPYASSPATIGRQGAAPKYSSSWSSRGDYRDLYSRTFPGFLPSGSNSHDYSLPHIIGLPDELLQSIFSFVPDTSIFSISLVCRRFYHLSSLPISWRTRCAQYTFWEPHHCYQQKLKHSNPSEVQWKRLFVRRYRTDKRVTELLDGIIKHSTDRTSRFEKIAQEGYDAKDCLKKHLEIADNFEDSLARRYYASEALAFIHRKRAIDIWKRVGDNLDVPLEEALGAYDLFVTRGANRDVEATTRSLDDLAQQFRDTHPHHLELTAKELASTLIAYMRSVGFTGAGFDNYHALKNSFLGLCLDSNRATLPLTTVTIFCALGTRLGLDVKPCGFTYHVVAIVSSPDPSPDPINNPTPLAQLQSFWDPFKTHLEFTSPELELHLRSMGMATTPKPAQFLSASNTRELIVRVARNILESVRLTGPQPMPTFTGNWECSTHLPEKHAALYAALTASVICGPPASTRLLEHMCTLMQRDFGMDVGFFEEDMARLISDDDAMLLHDICSAVRKEDATPKKPMYRYARTISAPQPEPHPQPASTTTTTTSSSISTTTPVGFFVRYRIGTIFKHRRYGYEAVITGWTPNCATNESWIRTMDVDKLKRGRHQPFYNVFVGDGSSRYVAEDNIVEIRPAGGHSLAGFLVVGKWFRRFEERWPGGEGGGRFVSNLAEEYPDD